MLSKVTVSSQRKTKIKKAKKVPTFILEIVDKKKRINKKQIKISMMHFSFILHPLKKENLLEFV